MDDFDIRDVSVTDSERLADDANVHQLTAQIMLARGTANADEVQRFLEPRLGQLRAPQGLADLEPAVERICRAIRDGETVGVFGDYDVDGVTTAALLSSVIEALGGRAVPRVARRSAGYGFGVADATFFADSMCHLVITGDCGTSDIDAILAAKRRGLDVIVIDHHTVPNSSTGHPALALINPFRDDSRFAFTGFASVGLAFYVMRCVQTRLRSGGYFADRPAADLTDWLDLVALGTIADLVPLSEENRILTSWGLKVLNERRRPGLVELLRNAGVADDGHLTAREVSWKIAPRLNAPGRLGDAEPALRLLLARDTEQAQALAAAIEEKNDERRCAQDEAYAEALEMIESDPPSSCAVIAGNGWKPGVVGIVAARLVDLLHCPVFAIAIDDDGVARGSARTCGGVSVYDALAESAEHLERFGGHAAAAGLTMESANISALRTSLEAAVAKQREGSSPIHAVADAEVAIADLIDPGNAPSRLAHELESLRPFGKGNPELSLVARRLEVREARVVGASREHLKLVLSDGNCEIGAIGFGLGERKPSHGDLIDVLCSPLFNRWRGTTRIELQLHDFRAVQSPIAAGEQSQSNDARTAAAESSAAVGAAAETAAAETAAAESSAAVAADALVPF